MNESTRFTYQNALGSIAFHIYSPFWITDIDCASSIAVSLAESRSYGQIGTSVVGQSVLPRTLGIEGSIAEPLLQNRAQLLRIIAPEIESRLVMEENGEEWYLDVLPVKTPEITPGTGLQFFSLRLFAAYPYWRTSAAVATQLAGLSPVFSFPFYTGGAWFISKFSSNYFKTVHNTGNVPAAFTLTFTARAQLENPEMYHMGTGEFIRVNKTMQSGESIVINTQYGSRGAVCVAANGEESNGFAYLDIESCLGMALLPGDNLLRLSASAGRAGLSARLVSCTGVKSGA